MEVCHSSGTGSRGPREARHWKINGCILSLGKMLRRQVLSEPMMCRLCTYKGCFQRMVACSVPSTPLILLQRNKHTSCKTGQNNVAYRDQPIWVKWPLSLDQHVQKHCTSYGTTWGHGSENHIASWEHKAQMVGKDRPSPSPLLAAFMCSLAVLICQSEAGCVV